MKHQHGLLGAIIGQRISCCYNRQVVWRLTTRIFDVVAIGGLGIIAFRVGIIAKKAEVCCANLAVSNDQEKHLGSSRTKGFAVLGNWQRRLTE